MLLLLQLHAPVLLLPAGTIAATALHNSCCCSIASKTYNGAISSFTTQAAVHICTVRAAQCSILHHQHLC
jgi:hypothetical protein